RQAARLAMQSLQGVFSENIKQLKDKLIALRIYIEAAIDFPEEEIDFLADENIANDLANLETQLAATLAEAQQGSIMREGIHAVIIGKPNAGKSSLLNALAGQQSAIVTHIEGTTRDVLRETIQIDGIPMHVTDTAGIREARDAVEKIGIERAIDEISRADLILLVTDAERDTATDLQSLWPKGISRPEVPVLILRNKVDLTQETPGLHETDNINISAKHDLGLDALKQRLKEIIGYQEDLQGKFLARRRHLTALEKAQQGLTLARSQLAVGAGELVAEELRLCQQSLSEITGEFTADDLLGEIFSSFCIGK
ncbi:MAG: tRNA modification GTPase, partial [Gammaproteobacteria bacterium]|nr:tRNA modification GTPase [Gammaproteobacteria bacterium]